LGGLFPKRPSTGRANKEEAVEDVPPEHSAPRKKVLTPNEKKDVLLDRLKSKCEEYKTKLETREQEIAAAGEALESCRAEGAENLKRVEAQKMGKERLLDALGKEAEAAREEIEEIKQANARLEAKGVRLEEVEGTLARTKVLRASPRLTMAFACLTFAVSHSLTHAPFYLPSGGAHRYRGSSRP